MGIKYAYLDISLAAVPPSKPKLKRGNRSLIEWCAALYDADDPRLKRVANLVIEELRKNPGP